MIPLDGLHGRMDAEVGGFAFMGTGDTVGLGPVRSFYLVSKTPLETT